MAKTSVGLLLVKQNSKRLKNKNTLPINGKPMWQVNTEKCLEIFDKTYISSDSDEILKQAEDLGAIPIKRGEELCGDTPNITVYKHALEEIECTYFDTPDAIVAVQANSPTIDKDIINRVKDRVEGGVSEVMTCHEDCSIYGSVWGLSREKIENYGDPYNPEPTVLIVDKSIDVHTLEDYNKVI